LPLARLEYETELVNGAKATTESKALVHVFFAERETRKVPAFPMDESAAVKLAAIIGAGTMARDRDPVLRTRAFQSSCWIRPGCLDRGIGVVDTTYEAMVKRGRLRPRQVQAHGADSMAPRLQQGEDADVG